MRKRILTVAGLRLAHFEDGGGEVRTMPTWIIFVLAGSASAGVAIGYVLHDRSTELRRTTLVVGALVCVASPFLLSGASAFMWSMYLGMVTGYGFGRLFTLRHRRRITR